MHAKLIIPVVNAVLLSVFTIMGVTSSFSLFITASVIFGAIGLIFMRRKTANDRFYVRSALITTALCLVVYGILGIYQNTLSLFTFIIFVPVMIPAYLSMGYALATIFRR